MLNLNEIHYKVYLDDIRNPTQTYPETLNTQWVIVRSYNEFVKVLNEKGLAEFYSFDHDISMEHYNENLTREQYKEKTGYDCAKQLVEYCLSNGFDLPPLKVHSMNPIGRKNIESLFDNFYRYKNNFS